MITRDVLDGVELTPGHGGVFKVYADGDVVFDKDEEGYDIDVIVDAVAERANAA